LFFFSVLDGGFFGVSVWDTAAGGGVAGGSGWLEKEGSADKKIVSDVAALSNGCIVL
jgi:hypothetical protein